MAGCRLDGRDDLTGDAQLGEGSERGLAVRAEVPRRLEQPDERLLLDVVGVRADEEVAAGLASGEAPVPAEEGLDRLSIALVKPGHELLIGQLGVRVPCGPERHDPSCGSYSTVP